MLEVGGYIGSYSRVCVFDVVFFSYGCQRVGLLLEFFVTGGGLQYELRVSK